MASLHVALLEIEIWVGSELNNTMQCNIAHITHKMVCRVLYCEFGVWSGVFACLTWWYTLIHMIHMIHMIHRLGGQIMWWIIPCTYKVVFVCVTHTYLLGFSNYDYDVPIVLAQSWLNVYLLWLSSSITITVGIGSSCSAIFIFLDAVLDMTLFWLFSLFV